MAKGFDCATPLTAVLAGQFKANGYDFVCRYLVPSGWKHLSKEEADAIKGAGLNIVSVWETTADRALGGYDAGYEDGKKAAECAAAVGQPSGSAIYFAVDFDATFDQMTTVIAYIHGANDATPNFATGVYGSYAVCKAVKESKAASRAWQTYAWSRGQKYDQAQIYQYKNDVTENGIGIDLDESYGGEGWWGQPEITPVPQPTFPVTVEDANKIIALLQGAWNAGFDQDEVHRLANVVRKVSGQEEEQ